MMREFRRQPVIFRVPVPLEGVPRRRGAQPPSAENEVTLNEQGSK
jgi:hypothetical protein